MPGHDTAFHPLHDVLSAFGLLSRIPVPTTPHHRANAVWAWPIVGCVIGLIAVAGGCAATRFGLSAATAAVIALMLPMVLTGAMHEDGLADTLDGLFGGWTVERRLEIMKDSRIGTYGTLGLVITALLGWTLLEEMMAEGAWMKVVAAASLSRVPMSALMVALPNARKTGLSSSVGRPAMGFVFAGAVIAITLGIALTEDPSVISRMLMAAVASTLAIGAIAKHKIGGQTGDILGASQQLSFLAALACA